MRAAPLRGSGQPSRTPAASASWGASDRSSSSGRSARASSCAAFSRRVMGGWGDELGSKRGTGGRRSTSAIPRSAIEQSPQLGRASVSCLKVPEAISVRMAAVPMRATTVRFGEDLWELLDSEVSGQGISAAQFVRDATIMRLGVLTGAARGPGGDASRWRRSPRARSHAAARLAWRRSHAASRSRSGAPGRAAPRQPARHARRGAVRPARAARGETARTHPSRSSRSSTRTGSSSRAASVSRSPTRSARQTPLSHSFCQHALEANAAARHRGRPRAPAGPRQRRDPRPRRRRLRRRPAHRPPADRHSGPSASSTTSRARGHATRSTRSSTSPPRS